jgi:hypothetical protein
VTLKEWFIDRDILDTHDPAVHFQLTDLIHEQEWVPVGQYGLNLHHIHP